MPILFLSSPTPVPDLIGDPVKEWIQAIYGDPGVFAFPASCEENGTGSPKFTNEVQHLVKVLPWDATIHISPLKTAVKWPAYTPRDTRSAKLRQLWIARHRGGSGLNRNGSTTQGYQPGYADQQARARRWQGSKLDRDSTLRATVLAQLQHGWSPQQVAGRLAREQHRPVISHETIYRFIYAQMARKTEYSWRHYLPRAKAKRGRRASKAVARRPSSPCAARWPSGRAPSRIAVPPVLGGRPDVVPDLRPSHLDPP